MPHILTTKEVTVQTVQVTIQALKVGPKQVTMGLFRQLPHEVLLDPDTVQLRGVPWGHVRYWWDGDGRVYRDDPKLHVVWQRGEELRRGIVYQEPDPARMKTYRAQLQADTDACVLAHLPHARTFEAEELRLYQSTRTLTLDGRLIQVDLPDKDVRVLRDYWRWRDGDPEQQAETELIPARAYYPTPEAYAARRAEHVRVCRDSKTRALEAYQALLEARGITESMCKQLRDQARLLREARDAYAAQWAQQWQVLTGLPQLFIAV